MDHSHRRAEVTTRRRRAYDERNDDPHAIGNANRKEGCWWGIQLHTHFGKHGMYFKLTERPRTANAIKPQDITDSVRGRGA
jgi:hypothetical protein